jgi:hypothetical protein
VVGNNPVGTYSTLAALAAAGCPVGAHIEGVISAPPCWDGKNLDSANHRDHVAYASYGSWGYLRCPADHPYLLPTFTMGVFYTIADGDDLKLWHFASDELHPELPAGSTFHADWFGAWDNTIMAAWTDNCINKSLDCYGGNLGNGYKMKMYSGFSMTANPRLVPIPS